MKALYHLPTNTLEQLPEMEKPICINGISPNLCSSIRKNSNMKECECLIYNAHIASLRTINCDPSCREIWTDKQEVEEGKGFEIKECRTWTKREKDGWGCAECCNRDRCDEDCDATYYRPKCPFCKGKGWFKEQPLFAFPIKEELPAVPLSPPVQQDEDWGEVLRFLINNPSLTNAAKIEKLKGRFTITKKQ